MYDPEKCLLYDAEDTNSHKWLRTISKFQKKIQQTKDLELLREVICAVLSLILFFSMIYWILTKDFHVPAKNETLTVFHKPHMPVIMWYNRELSIIPENGRLSCSNTTATFECEILLPGFEHADAYIFYATLVESYPLPRDMNTLWGLVHEESPRNRLELMFEGVLNLFNYTSTYSRYSDVPMPLIWMKSLNNIVSKQYFVSTAEKNSLLHQIAPVFYIQSDCDTSTERDVYVNALMDFIPIDSYGDCLQNKELPLDPGLSYNPEREYLQRLEDETLLRYLSRYKFVIAIENGVCNDYVTEKFWRSIYMGVVPIYYGSPLIRDWLPNNKSAILLEDFPTPELLSQHLHYLLQNDTAYDEYLEHKILGLISNEGLIDEAMLRPYQLDFVTTVEKLECLMCERLHNRDSTKVNIVTKKHLDCPVPTSALTLSVNPDNLWLMRIEAAKPTADTLVKALQTTKVTNFEERYDFPYPRDNGFIYAISSVLQLSNNDSELQLATNITGLQLSNNYSLTNISGSNLFSDYSGIQLYANISGSKLFSDYSGIQLYTNISGSKIFSYYSGIQLYTNISGSKLFSNYFGIQLYTNISGLQLFSNYSGIELHSDSHNLVKYRYC